MRAAFLANSFHLQKTHSSDFFIDLLRSTFEEVVVIPSKEAWAQLPGSRWDALIVWQELPDPRELDAFGIPNVILVPMYDACPKEKSFWLRYSRYKVLCFSSTLHESLRAWGLNAFEVRYYPPPPASSSGRNELGLTGFFWPRTNEVNWDLIREIIGAASFEHIQLHWTSTIHPGVSGYPSSQDVTRYRISVSSWTNDRQEYERLVRRNCVFFAPRLLEGIGMSFVEALSWGLCVVAPDRPTMNEYIRNGVNGILYDPASPRPVDFSKWKEYGAAAAEECREGALAWEKAIPHVREFVREPLHGYLPRRHPWIRLRGRSKAFLRRLYRSGKKLIRSIQ